MSVVYPSLDIPHSIESDRTDVLAQIYEKDINLVCINRELDIGVSVYAKELVSNKPVFSICKIVNMNTVEAVLNETLPDYDDKDAFIYDLYQLCDMYSLLFGLVDVGLRLTVLERAMCPRFHVDNTVCRLLTTYNRAGSEWLAEDNLDRSKLGRGNNGKPDKESGVYLEEANIMQLKANSIALLKGESWPDNTGRGLVHRSPAVAKGESRLLLSLDFV